MGEIMSALARVRCTVPRMGVGMARHPRSRPLSIRQYKSLTREYHALTHQINCAQFTVLENTT
jgi:hypothetical protein